MKYDLIIVAKSTEPRLIETTQRCINSARADEADLNIILVETGDSPYVYEGVNDIIQYTGKFVYNRALNRGLELRKGDIHILANNDLIFHKGWSAIGQQMIDNNFDSASALSQDIRQRHFERGDYVYEGYHIGSLLTGWCIFTTRHCIDAIGRLDESVDFWYSDNIYADQLQAAGLRHGLFCNVRIDHITSVTLRTLTPRQQADYSIREIRKYRVSRTKFHAKRKKTN